jgi:tetratricopeptide (TPR) repeat protein
VHLPIRLSQRLVAVLFLLLTTTSQLLAQDPASPDSTPPAASKATTDPSLQPAIYEFRHGSMRYENDGSGVREVIGRMRVQTAAGLASAGQLVFNYTAVDEEVEIRSVRVFKPDGSVIVAGPEAVQDLSAPVTREAPMYTDAREKHITVPGVSVGDAVEYDVVWKAKPFVAGEFWQTWIFASQMISLDEQFDLNVPAARALKIKSSDGIPPSTKLEGDRRLYHWSTSNLKVPPPLDFFHNFTFDVTRLLEGPRPAPPPRVTFSTFQSWADVAAWYAKLESDRRVPTAQIRAQADAIVKDQQTDEGKAQALYYWVSQNIRYVSLSFGVGRYQPHFAAQVLANRYGDCKDKTTLLEAMLAAEGLQAQPVLVNAREEINPDVPNPFAFDHAITFLKLGSKETWLDTTLGVGPYGYLLPQLRGKQALVVRPAATGLQQAPTDFPFTVEYHLKVDGTIDASGTLNATVELETAGDLEVLIRVFSDHSSREQLEKTADEILARTNKYFYGSAKFTGFKVLNGSDIAKPVKAEFQFSGKPMYVNVNLGTPKQLAAAATAMPIERWQLLSLLPASVSKPGPDGKPRPGTAKLYGPRVYGLTLDLTFPSLGNVDLPPNDSFRLAQPFAEYESSDAWTGLTFHASRLLTLRAAEVQPADSQQYSNFVQKVVEKASEGSSLFKKTSDKKTSAAPKTASDAPADPTPKYESAPISDPTPSALESFKQGQGESSRKNWATAAADFQSAVQSDPAYADAWRELGRAQMYANHFPEAETAFRKYLELAPTDSRAYANMSWALYREQKYDDDVALLLKRVDDAPLDADALGRLGSAYLALKQPEKAVPVLDRAISRAPKNFRAYYDLGHAYLLTHHDDKAIIAFRSSLQYDDSDARLNSIAYLLAESNSNLDLAEKWSEHSISVIEQELNDSSLATAGARSRSLVVKLATYWDTFGWIKFQQNNMLEAQKYLLAAWQISDDLTIGMHLGRVYESQGQKDQAIDMYLAALATVPSDRQLSEDGEETLSRLRGLLGGDPQASERLAQFRQKPSTARTVSIANSHRAQGIAQYSLIVGGGSTVLELAPNTPDDALAGLVGILQKTQVPQSFPNATIQKLPRLGTLACAAPDQPCIFTLLPAGLASRLAPNE